MASPIKVFEVFTTIFNFAIFFFIVRMIFRKKKGAPAGSPLLQFLEKISQQARHAPKGAPTSTQPAATPLKTPIALAFSSLSQKTAQMPLVPVPTAKLQKSKQYLQIALNSTLDDARSIISRLPPSDRIILEAGTPLIKIYGAEAIRTVRAMAWPGAYVVADAKTADLAEREVEMAATAGANGITCLGVARVETIDRFIAACKQHGLDSMVDMMNVESPHMLLRQLRALPDVVVLHRGVDETEFSKEKQIPYYQIKQIRGSYNITVAVAGGDTIREVQRAVFNDANIVVVWKDFYSSSVDTVTLAAQFLKEIK
ncbi:MAG: orotidine 5'-phosphate decarboxylase [Patescibacteria group bacterium]|nr:orotidine 5'-phosphate decarboxylase [Patescibacteria group bacterium]MDD5715561.1 orotidine 5'-phosphate decarboxylase [Patescibacteria group bacterium]